MEKYRVVIWDSKENREQGNAETLNFYVSFHEAYIALKKTDFFSAVIEDEENETVFYAGPDEYECEYVEELYVLLPKKEEEIIRQNGYKGGPVSLLFCLTKNIKGDGLIV